MQSYRSVVWLCTYLSRYVEIEYYLTYVDIASVVLRCSETGSGDGGGGMGSKREVRGTDSVVNILQI